MSTNLDFLGNICYQAAILEETVHTMRIAVDDLFRNEKALEHILAECSMPSSLANFDAYYVFCVVLRDLERISKDLDIAAKEADEAALNSLPR